MAIDGQTVDKLRGYLRELTPRARAMLLAELERREQRGQPLPGGVSCRRSTRPAPQLRATPGRDARSPNRSGRRARSTTRAISRRSCARNVLAVLAGKMLGKICRGSV